jgi:hypothetical protein
MPLNDAFIETIRSKTVEAGEHAVVDIIVRKFRAQGIVVSKTTRDSIARAVHERDLSAIQLPDAAVPAGVHPKVSFTKTDLRVFRRIERRRDRVLPDIVDTATTKLAGPLLKTLVERWPDQAKSEAEALEFFRRHHLQRWSAGLSGLAMMLTITRELGSQLAPRYSLEADQLPHVLIRLHGRACTVADEVLTLLQAGFGDAAMARWRTLHELAVTSMFLQQHGEMAAERFVAHEALDALKAAQLHQRHARRLGLKRLHRRQIDQLKRVAAKHLTAFGPSFKGAYGWAASGPNDYVRGFEDMEKRISLSHWRPSYKAASHQVHATANAMFAWIARYGRSGFLGGRSVLGVADPGQCAAISLNQVSAAVVMCGRVEPQLDTIIMLKVLGLACTATINNFLKAHRRQQQELRRRHQETQNFNGG